MSGERMQAIQTQVHKQTGAKGSSDANRFMISEVYSYPFSLSFVLNDKFFAQNVDRRHQ